MKVTICAFFSAILCLGVVGGAQAHAKLLSADPPMDGSSPARVSRLQLHFSEEVSGKLSGAAVKTADGKLLPLSAKAEGKALTLMLKAPLPAGAYTVDWHAVASDDGHRTTGHYKIMIR